MTAPAQFSTRALLTLTEALRRFEARQQAEAANRERTALALGVEPGEVTKPLTFEFNQYAGSAADSF